MHVTDECKILVDHRTGYELIRVGEPGDGERTLAHHRVLAYAWDTLETPFSDEQVDHVDRCRVHNAEDNLEAVGPIEHGRITRQRARAAANGGRT
jgi:hypothetical protein